MNEELTTHYYAQHQGIIEHKFLFTKHPTTGMERYIISCDILRDNPDILQVHWDTPSQKSARFGVQNRSEDYRYSKTLN